MNKTIEPILKTFGIVVVIIICIGMLAFLFVNMPESQYVVERNTFAERCEENNGVPVSLGSRTDKTFVCFSKDVIIDHKIQ